MSKYNAKINIILKWLDKQITIPSYQEDKVKQMLLGALLEIQDMEEKDRINEEKDD